MATAVTIFLRSPILPSRRSNLNARSTRICLIHELPPCPPLSMKRRSTDTDTTSVSNRAQPSAHQSHQVACIQNGGGSTGAGYTAQTGREFSGAASGTHARQLGMGRRSVNWCRAIARRQASCALAGLLVAGSRSRAQLHQAQIDIRVNCDMTDRRGDAPSTA
jgi:hypothetical protein